MHDLDFRFEMPKSISHKEVVIPLENCPAFRYTADAVKPWFDGVSSIRGGVSIRKEEETTAFVPVRRFGFWRTRLATAKTVRVTRRRVVWEFRTRFNCFYYYLCDSPNDGYRKEIAGLAINGGIVLTDELMDMMFGPIDAKIRELFEMVKRLSEGDSSVRDSTFADSV